jgi:hypothetical protein
MQTTKFIVCNYVLICVFLFILRVEHTKLLKSVLKLVTCKLQDEISIAIYSLCLKQIDHRSS